MKLLRVLRNTLLAALLSFPAYAQDTIRIGAVLPVTGKESKIGSAYKQATELAVKEANDAGGLTIGGKKLKILLAAAEIAAAAESPGTVAGETPAGLRVAAGNGYVLLREVQLEGKKRLPIRDFLRGIRIAPGQVLG